MQFYNNKSYESVYPKDLFKNLSFDGNLKVENYFVKKTPNWPNGWNVYYISIFYDQKNNKVMGWGRAHNWDSFVKNWDEKF